MNRPQNEMLSCVLVILIHSSIWVMARQPLRERAGSFGADACGASGPHPPEPLDPELQGLKSSPSIHVRYVDFVHQSANAAKLFQHRVRYLGDNGGQHAQRAHGLFNDGVHGELC